jgi:pyruvate,water dikinase
MAGLHQRAELKQGEILVARQTDPGWAPLFFLASGLVIERGGMLSHGAIVAREFGIPAVIALPKATEILQTGEVLVVDGDQGRVSRAGGQ